MTQPHFSTFAPQLFHGQLIQFPILHWFIMDGMHRRLYPLIVLLIVLAVIALVASASFL
jgi:hypothetical protein